MMRIVVILLLLANVVVYGWTQGLLDDMLGPAGRSQREPQRLAAQVQPNSVAVLSPQAAQSALAAAQAAVKSSTACLEAGPFSAASVAQAESELGAVTVADGSIGRIERQQSAVWAVYMGKFEDRAALQRKVEEIKRLRLVYEDLRNAPAFQPGLVLGRFDSRGAADEALTQMTQRGLRTAKVVALSEPGMQLWLRAGQADPDLAARLVALKVPALGAGFKPCAD